ncbi:MAG TPA: hypothetical protein VK625_14905 [Flavitalea sp.]|nr:hypothetical protein [Flavitalea sp.]
MANDQRKYPSRPDDRDKDCKDCEEKDLPTQAAINFDRKGICDKLYEWDGEKNKQEKKFDGENLVYNDKKCLFRYSEENYRRFRNFDITIGTELAQTNESVKANVTQLKDWNKKLSDKLKEIAKGVKEAKGKFSDLKKAACDLDSCFKDSCNSTQRRALTGKTTEDCKDQPKIPDACNGSDNWIKELICMPKALATDIDSIFKSAHDVVGIQVFSNIDTLEPQQKLLDEKSKSFKTLIGDIVKARETDLKKLQEDLVKSVQDITKAAIDRNNARATFEGYYDAAKFLCCPKCRCLKQPDDKICEPRLKGSEECICEICGEVKVTFCCTETTKPPATTQNHYAD